MVIYNMDIFHTIQKKTFDYCDNLTDENFFEIVDSFVFENNRTNVLKDYLEHMECYKDYLLHLEDIEKKPYFLKCSGSRLYYLEYVKQSLLVSSYNRLKRKCKN